MKVNILLSIGKSTDPAPTLAHYTRARWIGKKKVILSGLAECQGKRWKVCHEYLIPCQYWENSKEEIVEKNFGWLLGALWAEVVKRSGSSEKKG